MYSMHSPWSEAKINSVIKELAQAWIQMAEYRQIDPIVRPVIAESWLRCLQIGVPYDRKVAPILWDGKLVDESIKSYSHLIEIARPVMNQLYQYISGSGFIIALSNAEGILLEILGDPEVLERGYRNNFVVGADWSEYGAGTNAIGTCLTNQSPIQILASEHYCKGWQDWTCSSALIRDPLSKSILGVIDVSGGQELVHAHNLGLVATAAQVIEHQLGQWQVQLAQQIYHLVLDITCDGILVVERNGIVSSINSNAARILGLQEGGTGPLSRISALPELAQKFDACLEGKEVVQEEVTIGRTKGKVIVSCMPIGYGKQQFGVLIAVAGAKRQWGYGNLSSRPNLTTGAQGAKSLWLSAANGLDTILSRADSMKPALEMAKIAAHNDANVLILGESGTGKELFARAIHDESNRAHSPFVALNCGAIPRDLVASELFGYTEGSFTGAIKRGKRGKFELAGEGTLFLDEIGEMPLDMQVALLRVLEERVFYPIGGEIEVPVTCRIMAATNQELMKQVQAGRFRADLYYRLNVLSFAIPPLRERVSDIVILSEYFLKRMGRSLDDLDTEVFSALLHFDWPGNVRQLKNVIERLVYMSNGSKMMRGMLPAELLNNPATGPKALPSSKEQEGEMELLYQTLQACEHNYSKAAQMLGISRATLYRKIRKFKSD